MDVTELGDRAWERGRLSLAARLRRLQSKTWMIGQAAVAAAVAWIIATRALDHQQPIFAPLAAVICLGTSYGQRHRRVLEVTAGVAVGVGVADLFTSVAGRGVWQLAVVIAIAMSAAVLLDTGVLLIGQAASQSIVVATILPLSGGPARVVDALVGGGVALVAATVVPGAPLRRPRESAATVVGELARLLDLAEQSASDADEDRAAGTLDRAREAEVLLTDLRAAAAEGLDIVRTSPFRRRTHHQVRTIADVVKPLDRALRNTRVLVRRVAVAARLDETMPPDYLQLMSELAEASRQIAKELSENRMPEAVQPELERIADATGRASEPLTLSAAVVLAQLRSIVVDLLQLTGKTHAEAVGLVPTR
jgi:uncharacterized membrane protein YgaE (UPF0421/DUF939 family)